MQEQELQQDPTQAQVNSPLDIDHSKVSKADDELLKYVFEKVDRDLNALKQKRQNFNTWNNLYKGIQERKHYDGLANLFVPETLKSVETITSIVHASIFDVPTFVRFRGMEMSDEQSALNMTYLNDYQMQENKFELAMADFIRSCAIYGTSVGKLSWDFKVKNKKAKTLDKETGETKVEEQLETIRDIWVLERVDIKNIVCPVDMDWANVPDADYVAEVKNVSKTWLQLKAKKKWLDQKSLDKVLALSNGQIEQDAKQLKDKSLSDAGINSSLSSNDKDSFGYIEYWGLLPAKYLKDKGEKVDDDELMYGCVVIVNRTTVLKLDKIVNIYWHGSIPYLFCPFVPVDGCAFGMGVPEITQSLQEELNDTRNQTMDNKTLILSHMWLVDRTSGIDLSELKVKPFRVIKVNQIDGIKPLSPAVLTGVGVNIEGVIKEDLRQSVAAVSGLQGSPQPGVGSATEFQGLQSSAMSRHKMTVKMIGEAVLKPLFKMVNSLNNQFYDRKKMVRIIGESGIKHQFIGPEDIIGNMDVMLELSTDYDKNPNVTNQQRLNFANTIIKMAPEQIKLHWGTLKVIAEGLGIKDFETIYSFLNKESKALLTPQEEFDLMNMGQPVAVKPGDNHIQHLQDHIKDYNEMAHAMTPVAQEFLAAHIRDTMKVVQELVALQSQMAMNPYQALQAQGQPQGPGGVKSANPEAQPRPKTDNQINKQVQG